MLAGVADVVLVPTAHSDLDLGDDILAAALCCCHWCVLHCAQWLCRCAGSRPCCCGAVLCVLERGKRGKKENRTQHQQQSTASKKRQKSAPKRERGKQDVPKWKARQNTTNKQGTINTEDLCLLGFVVGEDEDTKLLLLSSKTRWLCWLCWLCWL